jgi:hypothetical protein
LLGLRGRLPNYTRQIQIRFRRSGWGKIKPSIAFSRTGVTVKYREIIADKSQQSRLELGLGLSH